MRGMPFIKQADSFHESVSFNILANRLNLPFFQFSNCSCMFLHFWGKSTGNLCISSRKPCLLFCCAHNSIRWSWRDKEGEAQSIAELQLSGYRNSGANHPRTSEAIQDWLHGLGQRIGVWLSHTKKSYESAFEELVKPCRTLSKPPYKENKSSWHHSQGCIWSKHVQALHWNIDCKPSLSNLSNPFIDRF